MSSANFGELLRTQPRTEKVIEDIQDFIKDDPDIATREDDETCLQMK